MALLVLFLAFQRELIRKNKEKIVVFMVTFIFAAYLCVGGVVFKKVEGPQEEIGHNTIMKAIDNVKVKHPDISDAAINDLFQQIKSAGVKGLPDGGKHDPKWTFGNSVFYSITLLTTIGYGHLSPLTSAGKIITIVYTGIGIPLTLFMMSLYVCRLMAVSASYKCFLFRKLKGPMTPVQINFIHISTVMLMILFGCFLIPAAIFNYLEDTWTFLDSLYYCFISLTTVGLGDYVPALNLQSPYVDLYRIGAGIFILYGVIVMMFMLAQSTDFYKHCYEDLSIPVTIHTEKVPINTPKPPTYGAIGVHRVQMPEEDQQRFDAIGVHRVQMPEDQQRLLQP